MRFLRTTTIVTIGLPDPELMILKPRPPNSILIHMRDTVRGSCCREVCVSRSLPVQFSVLIQTFVPGTRDVFGADGILAKHSPSGPRMHLYLDWVSDSIREISALFVTH